MGFLFTLIGINFIYKSLTSNALRSAFLAHCPRFFGVMASAISSKSSEANFLLSPFSKSVNYEQDARALFKFDNKLNDFSKIMDK